MWQCVCVTVWHFNFVTMWQCDSFLNSQIALRSPNCQSGQSHSQVNTLNLPLQSSERTARTLWPTLEPHRVVTTITNKPNMRTIVSGDLNSRPQYLSLLLPAHISASSGLHSQPHSVCSSRMSSFTLSTGSFPVRADLINIFTFFSFTLTARQVERLSSLVHCPLHLDKCYFLLDKIRMYKRRECFLWAGGNFIAYNMFQMFYSGLIRGRQLYFTFEGAGGLAPCSRAGSRIFHFSSPQGRKSWRPSPWAGRDGRRLAPSRPAPWPSTSPWWAARCAALRRARDHPGSSSHLSVSGEAKEVMNY